MKVVLDTNVVMSGIFFGGPPGVILEAWREARFVLVLSLDVFREYQRVSEVLGQKYSGVDASPLLSLLAAHSEWVTVLSPTAPISSDPDDDKFLLTARSARAGIVVSGDTDLLDMSEWGGIQILTPRRFVDEVLHARGSDT